MTARSLAVLALVVLHMPAASPFHHVSGGLQRPPSSVAVLAAGQGSTCSRVPLAGGRARRRAGAAISPPRMCEAAWTGFEEAIGQPAEFPERLDDALPMAGQAVLDALDDGIFRVTVQMTMAEFDSKEMPMAKGSIMAFVNIIGASLVERGLRVNFIFNSVSDASEATHLVKEDLVDKITINVLGLGAFGEDDDICVLVCPNNAGKDLRRIEDVERLMYAGPPKSMTSRKARRLFQQRPIILLNPSLEAIHQHSTPASKVEPMFMSDFTTAFFMDPLAIVSRSSEAALFKRYPSQWQLWMRSTLPKQRSAYKLVWEKMNAPAISDITPVFNDADDRLLKGGGIRSRQQLGIPLERFQ